MLLKFENETEWLAERRKNINSTEIAALFGLSEWKSRLRLWHEKAGNVESDFQESPYSIWGKRLQTAVGLGICEDHGWVGEDLSLFYFVDPELRLGASMDIRAICPERGPGLLEVKTTGAFQEEGGWFQDKAPIEYEFQIQGQLHLAIKDGYDISWGAIGALDGRKKDRVYPRMHDAALGAMIEDECRKFWRSIELDEPPPPDYLVDDKLLAELRGSIRAGEGVNLSRNNRAVELIERFAAADSAMADLARHAKEYEEAKTRAKNEILSMMGNAEKAIIGEYQVGAREQVVEERFNPGYSFRRFDVKKLKKGR